MKTLRLTWIWWLVCLLLLGSCSHLMHFDRAQHAFNQGAELENRGKLMPEAVIPASPNGFYSLAYLEVREALKDRTRLENDTVLANVLTLKALCEWKLKRYGAARASALEANQELKKYAAMGINLPRDQAVIIALEGLIRIDEVGDSLYQQYQNSDIPLAAVQAFYHRAIQHSANPEQGRLAGALSIIESARASAGGQQEVQVYLTLAQLAGLKVWGDAFDRLKNGFDTSQQQLAATERQTMRESINQLFIAYTAVRDKYLNRLEEQLPRKKQDPIYQYWDFLLL